MAESIIGLLRSLEQNIKNENKPNKRLNQALFRPLLADIFEPKTEKSPSNIGAIANQVSEYTYVLRTQGEYDRATVLEMLVEQFASKKVCLIKEKATPLTENVGILQLLVALSKEGPATLSEESYHLLHDFHRGRNNLAPYTAPRELFGFLQADKKHLRVNAFKRSRVDLFNLD